MKKERIPVAAEGYPFIGYSALLSILSGLLGFPLITLILLVATTFILMFFRDPERTTPEIDRGVISPADGKIIFVETTRDERFADEDVLKISIFMNVFNVHVNRIPFSGTVNKVHHVPGSFLAADSEKAHLNNEYCAVTIITGDQKEITMVQIAGLIARRIICRLETGDEIKRGKRYGLIRFGSRVDLYLPRQSNPAVGWGQGSRRGEPAGLSRIIAARSWVSWTVLSQESRFLSIFFTCRRRQMLLAPQLVNSCALSVARQKVVNSILPFLAAKKFAPPPIEPERPYSISSEPGLSIVV